MEVYMDDYITAAVATEQQHLNHLANATMHGIHDVFTPDIIDDTDPISKHKLFKEGAWALVKDILGLTFNGDDKTVWLEDDKRNALLTILHGWIRASRDATHGIPFDDFRAVIYKIRHAFITIPAGKGLLSPFYRILARQPKFMFLHRNKQVKKALQECRLFLQHSITAPTKCTNLVTAWPDYVGIKDASKQGVGGIVIGERKGASPTVFRLEWPEDIRQDIVSERNPSGSITNSDLEMAGLLLLWLVMEAVCPSLDGAHVALFSDNSPTVHWVERLASRHSIVAMQLIRALALRLQLQKASPLTPLHIAGIHNAITDIPSRSFGSIPKWHCPTDTHLLNLFNTMFPLPTQASWNVFQISSEISTRVISILRTKDFSLDAWRRLPKIGNKYWNCWCTYVRPMGLDPHLQDVTFTTATRALTGFAARVRTGQYGRGRQITAPAVNSAITAVGKTIALARGHNPTKIAGSDKLLPRLSQMLEGWTQEDPPTLKKLPVEADIPEYIATYRLPDNDAT